MRRFLRAIKREVIAILPAAIFFLVLFHLLAFTRSLALAQYNVNVNFTVIATVGALILAKGIIVADNLPLINMFQRRALLIDVLWRTLIYGIFALMLQYLEEFVPCLIHTWNFDVANQCIMKEIVRTQFWANHLWLLFGLLVYCTISALVRVIGADRVRSMFLHSQAKQP